MPFDFSQFGDAPNLMPVRRILAILVFKKSSIPWDQLKKVDVENSVSRPAGGTPLGKENIVSAPKRTQVHLRAFKRKYTIKGSALKCT